MTTIGAARAVTPLGVRSPAEIEIEAGTITTVRPTTSPVEAWTLVPGFIDLQVNGISDLDVWSTTAADWPRLDDALLRQGVTAWLPTLTSGPLEGYRSALDGIAAMARRDDGSPRPAILGAHLEGPFLGDRPGAHRRDALVDIDLDWIADLDPVVRLVTLGPERPGALEAIAALRRRGIIVGIGHTDADAATVTAAVDAGASIVTHLYNAMAPFHHRAPGPVGVALTDRRLVAGIIADGIHVDPVAIRLAFAAKGAGGVALVSDQVAGDTAPDRVVRLADGTIAGATASLADGFRTAVVDCGVPLEAAVEAASTTPAVLLGDPGRGHVRAGSRADLVALDDDLRIVAVWTGGERVDVA